MIGTVEPAAGLGSSEPGHVHDAQKRARLGLSGVETCSVGLGQRASCQEVAREEVEEGHRATARPPALSLLPEAHPRLRCMLTPKALD